MFGERVSGRLGVSRVWRPRIGQLVGHGLFRPAYRLTVKGAELVPPTGPVILVSNHTGFLDGPFVFTVSPRPVHFLVKQETFSGLFGLVLHRTAVGRQLFAIGSNPTAARFSGIPVNRLRFVLFLVSGLLSGLAAALLTARLGSMRSNIGIGWELDIVTMVILGGVSIAGGVGSIPGVFLAVLVLGLVTFGMSLNNIPGQVVSVYIGALLIAVIAIPRIIDKLGLRRPA